MELKPGDEVWVRQVVMVVDGDWLQFGSGDWVEARLVRRVTDEVKTEGDETR